MTCFTMQIPQSDALIRKIFQVKVSAFFIKELHVYSWNINSISPTKKRYHYKADLSKEIKYAFSVYYYMFLAFPDKFTEKTTG